MKRRKWSSDQKLKIELKGLSGRIEIVKHCNKYQILQAPYYRWRDQLLQYGQQAFKTKKEKRLQNEIQ